MLRIEHQRAFGDLEHQLLALHAGIGERFVEHVEEPVVAKLARTDVD